MKTLFEKAFGLVALLVISLGFMVGCDKSVKVEQPACCEVKCTCDCCGKECKKDCPCQGKCDKCKKCECKNKK